jgi:hypothetical protein
MKSNDKKIKATLKDIKLVDPEKLPHDCDYYLEGESFVPNDIFHFEVKFEIFVGVESSKGSERFDVIVCSPSMVFDGEIESLVSGHGKIIIKKYSYSKVISYIENYVNICVGLNVEDVLRRVGLLGEWESEWET